MRKTGSLQISIPEPCTQNWNDMKQNEQGRFCTSCQKTVIDFSLYSDAMLYEFISKNSGHVCGRFRVHQLDRNISIPPQPHSRLYRMFIGLGLTLLFVPVSQMVKAQSYAPVVEESLIRVQPEDKAKPGKNTVQLKGRISLKGEKPNMFFLRHPEEFANVVIMQDGEFIASVVTDTNGYYSVYLHPCTYDIIAGAEGYIFAEQKSFTIRKNTVNELDFTVQADPDFQIVMGGMRSSLEYAEDSCSVKTKRK